MLIPRASLFWPFFFQIPTINVFQSGEDTVTAETAIACGTDVADVPAREHYLRFRPL